MHAGVRASHWSSSLRQRGPYDAVRGDFMSGAVCQGQEQ